VSRRQRRNALPQDKFAKTKFAPGNRIGIFKNIFFGFLGFSGFLGFLGFSNF